MPPSSLLHNVTFFQLTLTTVFSPTASAADTIIIISVLLHIFVCCHHCRRCPLTCARHLIHHQLHLLLHSLLPTSPRMRCASCMSFGMIGTCFAWIAHSLESSKRRIRYSSEASWSARRAVLCICKSNLKIWQILRTRCWKGAFLIKSSVLF